MDTDGHGFLAIKPRLAIPAARAIFRRMSTVLEIKAAIEQLSPVERVKLHGLVWPDESDAPSDTPPRARAKLAEAAKGSFKTGRRATIGKILDSPE